MTNLSRRIDSDDINNLAITLEKLSTSVQSALGAEAVQTTKGDLIAFSTVPARVAVGTNGQVLTADSTQTSGVKWAAVPATDLSAYQLLKLPVTRTASQSNGGTLVLTADGAVTNVVIVDGDSIAGLTVELANAGDGSVVRIVFGGVVATLTIAGHLSGTVHGTPPAAAADGTTITYVYEASGDHWWPVT